MATTMTFTTLQADVRRYLERGASLVADPTVFEQIPRLINLAERRIARELKVQGFQAVVTTVLIPSKSVYDKPDRWRDTISMNVGVGPEFARREPVLGRSYEYCREYWPDESATDPQPLFYADYDFRHWLLTPTPSVAAPIEIMYYELPMLLDVDSQTNWVTEYAPQLLLYATLLEATPFLKNDERIQTWQSFYDRAAAMLNGEDLAKILDRNASRKEA